MLATLDSVDLRRALLRGVALGAGLALAVGPRGFLLGLVAAPLALVEHAVRREDRRAARDAGALFVVWLVALAGLAAAQLQGPYAVTLQRSGDLGLALAAVVHDLHTPPAPVALSLLCLALSFSLITAARLESGWLGSLSLVLLTGSAATFVVPFAGLLFLTVCVGLGALPGAAALAAIDWVVDRIPLPAESVRR